MITLGFSGVGSIVQNRHLPEAVKNPSFSVRGFCSHNFEKAVLLADLHDAVAYRTFDSMLRDPLIDAVVISTPNCFHASESIAAMKAGKDVLCEKPMAITCQQGEKMIETACQTGQVLMIAHNLRLEPAVQTAKRHLESGILGNVISFSAAAGNEGPDFNNPRPLKDIWFFNKTLAGGGVGIDIAIHTADTLQFLLKEPLIPDAVDRSTHRRTSGHAPIEVEDTFIGLFHTPSGVIGTLTASWCYHGWQFPIVLHCEKGVLQLYCNPDYAVSITLADGTQIKEPSIPKENWPHGSGIMHAFSRAISQRLSPEITARPGLDALRAVLSDQSD